MFRVVYVSGVCACVRLVLRTVIDCIVNCSYKINKGTVNKKKNQKKFFLCIILEKSLKANYS